MSIIVTMSFAQCIRCVCLYVAKVPTNSNIMFSVKCAVVVG